MVDEYLIRLENHLKDIKALLASLAGVPIPTTTTLATLGVDTKKNDYTAEFSELKKLLESDEWPVAVDADLICNESNPEDKKMRAEGIMDFIIEEPLKGKKFLDFGCGEGLCAEEALNRGAEFSIGYDIKKQWEEDAHEVSGRQVELTTEWDQVKANGPYDIIFMYDVLDHVMTGQEDILKKIKSVSNKETRIYIRCHPWCSRSATHTYRTLNKAYTHLVFSEIELTRLGVHSDETIYPVIHPHKSYEGWFTDAGLTVVDKHPYNEEVEDIFETNKLIADRIKKNWVSSHDEALAKGNSFPSYQLRMQFIDYILKV